MDHSEAGSAHEVQQRGPSTLGKDSDAIRGAQRQSVHLVIKMDGRFGIIQMVGGGWRVDGRGSD